MSTPLTAMQILNREFLEIRAKILELAAAFDRLERAEGEDALAGDPRIARLQEALDILTSEDARLQRAEQVQLTFSRSYDPAWRSQFGLTASN
jgi:hypothetical protein